jgi:N-acetylmuramoyl-L-alanine amidase
MFDRDAIALTIYGEARGESPVGRIAVACVIRNRLRDGRWGSTYKDVCLAPKQFSCWNAGDPNRAVLLSALGQPVLHPILCECYMLADILLNEDTIRRLGNATHYYARSIEPPAWAATGEFVASVGRHSFFEKVA